MVDSSVFSCEADTSMQRVASDTLALTVARGPFEAHLYQLLYHILEILSTCFAQYTKTNITNYRLKYKRRCERIPRSCM